MKSTPDSTIIDGPEYIAVHIGGLATVSQNGKDVTSSLNDTIFAP
jgi:hypothetical protein